MSDKPFFDNGRADKNLKLIVRIVVLLILAIGLSMMFVINPNENTDKFSNETLWEAVHPFRLWDVFGLIGFVFFALYVSGLAGKVVYQLTEQKSENSSGLIHVVGVVCGLMMILFFL
jgi:hypothetical protein